MSSPCSASGALAAGLAVRLGHAREILVRAGRRRTWWGWTGPPPRVLLMMPASALRRPSCRRYGARRTARMVAVLQGGDSSCLGLLAQPAQRATALSPANMSTMASAATASCRAFRAGTNSPCGRRTRPCASSPAAPPPPRPGPGRGPRAAARAQAARTEAGPAPAPGRRTRPAGIMVRRPTGSASSTASRLGDPAEARPAAGEQHPPRGRPRHRAPVGGQGLAQVAHERPQPLVHACGRPCGPIGDSGAALAGRGATSPDSAGAWPCSQVGLRRQAKGPRLSCRLSTAQRCRAEWPGRPRPPRAAVHHADLRVPMAQVHHHLRPTPSPPTDAASARSAA